MDSSTSPLLRLPTEIRLLIWDLLILPSTSSPSIATAIRRTRAEDLTGAPLPSSFKPFTIPIHTLDTSVTPLPPTLHRSTYLHKISRFRSQTSESTYAVDRARAPTLPFHDATGLLRTCKQIHGEVASMLYSRYTFDFGYHVEALVPFLSDLTPTARGFIRRIVISKRAAPYSKHTDAAEWAGAMEYLAQPTVVTGIEHSLLKLTVKVQCLRPEEPPSFLGPLPTVAGEEDTSELSMTTPVTADWFGTAHEMGLFLMDRDVEDTIGLNWAAQMVQVKGLKKVDVKAAWERCFVPQSKSLGIWVKFSRSVERGFGEWCRDQMEAKAQETC